MRRFFAILAAGLIALAAEARADEVVQLVDGTKIVGTLVHYFDGVLTLKLPNGTEGRQVVYAIWQRSDSQEDDREPDDHTNRDLLSHISLQFLCDMLLRHLRG